MYLTWYRVNNSKQQDIYEDIKEESWISNTALVDTKVDTKVSYENEQEIITDENFKRVPDLKKYKELNPDVVGYIYIPDSVIDYPILQKEGSDDYYLKHNFDQKKGYPGCISIEKYANPCLNDKVSTIYGHNMHNGTMFGSLHRMYRDFDYFKAHEYFYIYTEESVRKYRFICITHYSDDHLLKDDFKMNDDGDFVFEGFKGDEPTKIMQALKDYNDEKAYFDQTEITDDDELMILSTCNTDRTRVVAVGLKTEDFRIN
ncbi:MAG: class B sortase [Lachnospiraceae bacterium]|nr:class B sortase [Lachnospiraceae bacterium]MBR5067049.1 class B sortase [Lachnospiraceae bacterium]MBR5917409.1 class B sortase [Lachnospiraceae bacterium]